MKQRKYCTKCKQKKPLTEFSKNNKNKGGLRCWCRKCCNDYGKEYRQTDEGRQIIIECRKKYRKKKERTFYDKEFEIGLADSLSYCERFWDEK